MTREIACRIMSAVLLGGLFGWYIHHSQVTWSVRGREAFIAYQAHRFDLIYANPSPASSSVVSTALLIIGACLLYELVAYCLSAMMSNRTPRAV
jgi:hypothetical protein